jgi:mannose-6-phosphate isomerase-like protein (cupin superfamily)
MNEEESPEMGEGDEHVDFVPNFEWLPPQVGYEINIEEVDNLDYYQGGANPDDATAQISSIFKGGGVHILQVIMDPGTIFPWHTHQPHTADLYLVQQGELKVYFKDNDEEIHTLRFKEGDEKLVYHSPGAHNQLESVGDEQLKLLNIKLDGGSVRGRLDQIAGNPEKHFDRDAVTHGLDIDTRRAHVFEIQDDAVEEW